MDVWWGWELKSFFLIFCIYSLLTKSVTVEFPLNANEACFLLTLARCRWRSPPAVSVVSFSAKDLSGSCRV